MWVFLNRAVLQGRVVSSSPNPQAGGPPLASCPRLLIQYIRSCLPHRRPFLHPQQFIRKIIFLFSCFSHDSPQWAMASSFTRFLDHTQRRIAVRRTPLDQWSGCRRDLYLTTHNNHNRQTSMAPVGFEPTISEALDRAFTGTGKNIFLVRKRTYRTHKHSLWTYRSTTSVRNRWTLMYYLARNGSTFVHT